MFTAYAVGAAVLAAVLVLSAALKITRHEHVVAVFKKVGAPVAWLPWLAGAELAGAAGLLLGLAAPLLGVAAGVGVFVYFTAAVWAHLRVGDRAVASPAIPGVLAVAAVGLRIASA